MDNKEFAKKLEFRTRQFGISIIKLSSSLPNSIEAKVIKNQLLISLLYYKVLNVDLVFTTVVLIIFVVNCKSSVAGVCNRLISNCAALAPIFLAC